MGVKHGLHEERTWMEGAEEENWIRRNDNRGEAHNEGLYHSYSLLALS
jgi:hypothetical protein